MKEKIAILGGGNIGKAIAKGLLASGEFPADKLTVTDLNLRYLEDLEELGIAVSTDNIKAVRESDIVIFCVQPTQVKELIEQVKDAIEADKQIIAYVVAAYEVKDILDLIGKPARVVRVMPNTAIAIRESMTCLTTHKGGEAALEKIQAIFNHLGTTMVIRETLMGAATILGACGIAYFLRYIRAASQGGIQVGFHADEAQIIAAQTAKGAASLLLQSGNHPEDEIDKVTTPRGCTIAGLNEMEHFGLSSAIIKGIITSYNEIDKLK